MSSLSNIGRRIQATKNIEKIATSMEMVASARFRKAQDKAKQTHFYIRKMEEILEKLGAASRDFKHPLFDERKVNKIALVVVTADRGLCGAYNSTILSRADAYLREHDPQKVELIVLGKKGVQHFHRKKQPMRSQWIDWSGKIRMAQVQALNKELVEGFIDRSFDAVWLLYTEFYNLMRREVVLEQFLPLGKLEESKKPPIPYIFEPGVEEISTEILSRFCLAKIETVLNQAYASELAARIFSMKAAAKNAEEMLEHLTLQRNKIRQAGITREILETLSSTGT